MKKPIKKTRWKGRITSGRALKPGVWTNLLPDIQQKIISKLPLPSLCRAKTVCKEWHDQVVNLKQISIHSKCYLSGMSMCCRAERSCIRIPQNHLPESITREGCLVQGTTPTGLVLIQNISNSDLVVTNLLTTRLTGLPRCPIRPDKMVYCGMQLLDDGQSFVVVKVLYELGHMHRQVYHYHAGKRPPCSWDITSAPEMLYSPAGDMKYGYIALEKSTMYYITRDNVEFGLKSIGLINGEQEPEIVARWASLPLSMWPNKAARSPKLAACAGRVLLAGVYPEAEGFTIGVLVLNRDSNTWEPLSKMPLTTIGRLGPKCVLFMYPDSEDHELIIRSRSGRFNYVYSLSRDTWSKLHLPMEGDLRSAYPYRFSSLGKVPRVPSHMEINKFYN